MARRGRILIGTSGWHYAHWRGPFYPEGLPAAERFPHYVRNFSTVEINNSFYRLPEAGTLRRWGRVAPTGFVFSVKASRYVTHVKKLKEGRRTFRPLRERLRALGGKLGPVLFQLPPKWKPDPGRLAAFLDALPERGRFAFEFRNPDWIRKDVLGLLERRGAAHCAWHLAGFESPAPVTADFAYVRLHGPGGKAYEGSYGEEALRRWARRIRKWSREGLDVFVYFDNDQRGYAPRNALCLKSVLNA